MVIVRLLLYSCVLGRIGVRVCIQLCSLKLSDACGSRASFSTDTILNTKTTFFSWKKMCLTEFDYFFL